MQLDPRGLGADGRNQVGEVGRAVGPGEEFSFGIYVLIRSARFKYQLCAKRGAQRTLRGVSSLPERLRGLALLPQRTRG